jgi:Protein of unknown function (DUF3828)
MTNNANKLKTSLQMAICLVFIFVSFTGAKAQTNNSPESRVKSFYDWYLKSISKQQDPSKNKTVMNSHLSRRFGGWFYSKAGQNLDYDIFINAQDWNEAWINNINVGKATINGNTAVVKITLGTPPDTWIQRLNISLVKEAGNWKIDRVKGL